MRFSTLILVFSAWRAKESQGLTHKCIHDQLPKQVPNHHLHVPETAKRQSANESWGPIRIHLDTTYLNSGSSAVDTYLSQTLYPVVINFFSEALQVRQVQGPFKVQPSCIQTQNGQCINYATPSCNGNNIPSQYLAPSGAGIPNTDYVMFISGSSTDCTVTGPGSGTLAYATYCAQDPTTDRPVVGFINVCPLAQQVPTDGLTWSSLVATLLHETTHALVFSTELFTYFRNVTTNEPLTPRDSSGQPISQGSGPFSLPSTNTLITTNERGFTQYKLVTPIALEKARNHFNCPTLNGVELESEGGSGSAYSHPERRIYDWDYMDAISSNGLDVVSDILLGVFEDSGWYKANYSKSQPLLWGKNKGCDFALNKCIANNNGVSTAPFPDHFCNSQGGYGCIPGGAAIGSCDLQSGQSSIPSYYQYYSDSSEGGTAEFFDYCPTIVPYSNTDCRYTIVNDTSIAQVGGVGSLCVVSNVTSQSQNTGNGSSSSSSLGLPQTCFRNLCLGSPYAQNGLQLFVRVGTLVIPCGDVGGQWVQVNDNQGLYSGWIQCPLVADQCDNACPNQCNRKGFCADDCQCHCFPGLYGLDCSVWSTTTLVNPPVAYDGSVGAFMTGASNIYELPSLCLLWNMTVNGIVTLPTTLQNPVIHANGMLYTQSNLQQVLKDPAVASQCLQPNAMATQLNTCAKIPGADLTSQNSSNFGLNGQNLCANTTDNPLCVTLQSDWNTYNSVFLGFVSLLFISFVPF